MSFSKKIVRSMVAVAMAGAAMIGSAVLIAAPAQAATTPVYYKLVGYASNKCLDVRREDGGGSGSRVQLWQCFGSDNQRFTLYPVGKTSTGQTYFQIISQAPGHLCMQVRGDSFANGAQIDEVGCSADLNQYWRWGSGNLGYSLPLVSMRTGKCLDISGNSTANGAKVQQWDCNGTTAQYFRTVT
ncbi:RICIN domain-containing protein [Pseudonocardia sp.]|jgi:hypothetical protein|uniref:RICIN domain-containing protein n=1 Tax=Pseudonocardia sp. TaxID=60912 RepID=UPI00260815F1|nr:RICIN domain-containing protein [Pseudonocardia sp.]MCW2716659.1 glucosylceramidase [Pseudonocardia sp.]MDT7614500.1 hypothetical protein [Pseudonocardiales bacterium]